MNFVIFTPALKKSAIGRMTALVSHALIKQGHKVTVVRTEGSHLFDQQTHDFGASTLPWTDSTQIASALSADGIAVYQIGDNFEFHEGGLHWLEKLPGIVCLHDFFLGSLFYGWAQNRQKEADSILMSLYGEEVTKVFFKHDGKSFIEYACKNAPMTEWVCLMASGVITHSSWGCDRVLRSCAGPVYVVPLAYDAPYVMSLKDKNVLEGNKESFIDLLTIGHINPNKRVESVIKAIGSSETLKDKIIYNLAGFAQPDIIKSLNELAESYGVKLLIHGEVSDIELSEIIRKSDIVSCLRWPSLEAASASAIEAMLYGKPVIVTDTGFYSEIPDEYVLKISLENEIAELQAKLKYLLENQDTRKSIGKKAQAWAIDNFSAQNYANELSSVANATINTAPIFKGINYFVETLNRWSTSANIIRTEKTSRLFKVFE